MHAGSVDCEGSINPIERLISRLPYEPLARRLSHTLMSALPGSGRDLRNVRYDLQAFEVMRRVLASDSHCVDVGAHQGGYLKQMMRRAPDGCHIALEPIPSLYQHLSDAFGGPKVSVLPWAASDRAGRATFQHVVSNPAYSGLRRRRFDRPRETVAELEVETRRLDDLVPHDRRVRLVKIDVEGAELMALRGALETLVRCRPFVVFEHGLGGLDAYASRPEDVHETLTTFAGLSVSTLHGWLAGHRPLDREMFARHVLDDIDYCFLAHP